ncbi:MAG TPA: stalk domain-containing protein [Caldisericia bacterium]|nr:stalk domain-containing protein [Caldisericia bacterium]HXK51630.1 stalk domain-containing protein [Caldisericia bacterium]
MKLHRFIAFVFLCCLITGSSLSLPAVEGKDSLSIEPSSVSFSITTTQRDTKAILLTNQSSESIQFSVVKQATEKSSSTEILPSFHGDAPQEVGSPWVTPQYNFARTGYNLIESTSPPFEQKWRSTYTKALLPPVLSGNNLYLPSEDGRIHHLHCRTGVKEEMFHMGEALYSVHLYTRYLIVATNTNLVLFDRIAKQVIWTRPYFVPSMYGVAAWEGLLFIGTQTKLICLDLITGREIWYKPGLCEYISTDQGVVAAVLDSSTLFIARGQSGNEIVSISTQEIFTGPAVFTQDNLYYCTTQQDLKKSHVVRFSLDGKKQWEYIQENYIPSSLAVDDQHVYFCTNQGDVVALERFSGKKQWEKNIHSPILIPPIVAWNSIYIGGNDGAIHCFNRNNGTDIWNYKMSFPLNSPFVMAQGFLYFADNTGNFYAFCRIGENVLPPYAPARVKGYPGNQKFVLSWEIEQPKPDLAGFHIYRKKEFERDFSFIDKTDIVSFYEDSPLENGEKVSYIVRAFDTYGNESTSSNMVTGIPSQDPTPTWLDYVPTSGSIKPNDSVILTVKVDGSKVPPGEYHAELVLLCSHLPPNENTIHIPVSMKTSKGDSSILQPPSLETITSSDTRALLKWRKYPAIWSIYVYRSTVSQDEMVRIASVRGTEEQYIDDTVQNGVMYYYSLKAVSEDGLLSDFSNELSIVPMPASLQILKENSITVFHPVFDIQGKADPKAKLTVQGHPIELKADGTFTTPLGVPVGISTLFFQAIATDQTVQEKKIEVNCISESYTIKMQIQNPNVTVNDLPWPWALEAPPILESQRTFVPLRFISEIVGGSVLWDSEEKRIQVLYKQNEVVLWIGKREILVNGKKEKIDAPPFILNGRTLVPLRFVTEPLGAKIEWKAETRTILLSFHFT